MCELILRMDYFTAILHCGNGEIFTGKPPNVHRNERNLVALG